MLKIQNMMDIDVGLLQWSIKVLMKNIWWSHNYKSAIKNENISDKELAEELLKPIVTKFNKSTRTFYRQYLGCKSSRYAIDT